MGTRFHIWAILLTLGVMPGIAQAATATFTPDAGSAVAGSEVNVLDGTGYSLAEDGSLTIKFTDLFATDSNDSFTLFHYSTAPFGNLISFSWGYMDASGSVLYQSSAQYPYAQTGGNSFSVGYAYWGCSASAGAGCNFIQINGDTSGYTLDAVSLNGAIVQMVAAPPTPEPSTWALMVLGFAGLGLQLKRSKPSRQSRYKKAILTTG